LLIVSSLSNSRKALVDTLSIPFTFLSKVTFCQMFNQMSLQIF